MSESSANAGAWLRDFIADTCSSVLRLLSYGQAPLVLSGKSFESPNPPNAAGPVRRAGSSSPTAFPAAPPHDPAPWLHQFRKIMVFVAMDA